MSNLTDASVCLCVVGTKDHILDIAERLVMRAGPLAFSYADIAAELGVRTAAVHYHFPTKDTLLLAVFRRAADRFDAVCRDAAVEGPVARVSRFVQHYRASVTDDRICMVGAFGAVLPHLAADVRGEAERFARGIAVWMTETIAEGQRLGAVRSSFQPSLLALRLLSNLIAGVQLRRLLGTDVLESMIAGIWQDLGVDDSIDTNDHSSPKTSTV